MKMLAKAIVSLTLAIVLFLGWYSVAANYGCDVLAGTYTFSTPAISSVLVLKADQSFEQALTQDGLSKHAEGTWRPSGGTVVFSGSLLRLPGQRSFSDSPGSTHSKTNDEFYGHFTKILTVYPELHFDAGNADIKLHRRLFR